MVRVKAKKPKDAERQTQWKAVGIILLVAIGVYSNTFQHGYVLDDVSVISENRFVTAGLKGIPDIWTSSYRDGYWNDSGTLYRPLTQSIFALQWQLMPNSPGFAHFFNVLVYGLLCVVMFFTLRALTKDEKTSLYATLIFAVIPLHTEVVANIKSLDEILSLLFGLLAWRWILNYIDKPDNKHLLAAAAFFTAGMFTKEGLISFVAIIPLSLWFFRSIPPKQWFKPSTPLLLGTGVYLITRAAILGGLTASISPSTVDNPMVQYGFLERWLTAFKLFGLYIQKLIYPLPFAYEYAFNTIDAGGLTDAFTWIGIVLAGLLLVIVLKGWKDRSFWAFLASYFILTMALYSNTVVIIGAMFAERFTFFASLAFAWMLAVGMQRLKSQPASMGLIAAVILIYGGITFARNPAWKSSYDLYAADMDVLESSCKAHYNYGLETMKVKALGAKNPAERQRLLKAAQQSFERALEIKPNYNVAKGQIALVYYRLGNHTEAIRRYNEVLAKTPGDDAGWNNLAGSYVATQQYEEALRSYEKAIALNPYYVDALGNAGAVNGMLGRHSAAIEYLQRAAALAPNNASYQQYLGLSYQALGQNDKAQTFLLRAQQLNNGR
jgi:tetratricopeptide (TPR) repeat protein